MSRRTSKQILGNGVMTVLTVALAFSAGEVMAADVCPARPQPQSSGPAIARIPGKMSPQARRMRDVDQAIDAGKYDVAERSVMPLTRVAMDKNDTPHRAWLRLARIRVAQGKFDEARVFATTATKAKDPKVRHEASYVLEDISYREGILAAKTRFDAANGLLQAGNLADSETAFKPLLQQPCPLPQAYTDRVKVKLASISVKQDNLDEASQWLASVDRAVDPDVATAAT